MKPIIHCLAAFSLCSGLALADAHPHWSYSGEAGPHNWGKISAEFHVCESGHSESPIDITTTQRAPNNFPKLQFAYQPLPMDVINTGHAVQFNAKPGTNGVMLGEHAYKLVQFHFHSPGKERFSGAANPLDAHLVHADADGKLLVVAVQFVVADKANPVVQALLQHVPDTAGQENKVESVLVNPEGLLPQQRGYFTYSGSLTTPPCSEGVTWIELKQPVSISRGQLEQLRKFYFGNQRPVQPVNDRTIYEVD